MSHRGTKQWPNEAGIGQNVQTVFGKVLLEVFSFTSHKRGARKTLPGGQRGQMDNKGIQNSRGFNVYFYFYLYQKMLHFNVRSVGCTLKALSPREPVPSNSHDF